VARDFERKAIDGRNVARIIYDAPAAIDWDRRGGGVVLC
jgi:hypothetical protein